MKRSQYEREGYLHLPSVLSKSEVDDIKEDILEILKKDLESKSGQEHFERSNKYRRFSLHLHIRIPRVARYVRHPIFSDIGGDLIGPDVDLYFTSTLTKIGRKNASVDWHQDIIYDPGRYESRVLCWTSISASGPENGGLYVVPGSHLHGVLPHSPSELYERDLQANGFSLQDAIPVRMDEGDILVIHPLLVHGSPENKGTQERVALMAGLQKPKAYSEAELKLRVEILRNGNRVVAA